jgi:hypothetical protein
VGIYKTYLRDARRRGQVEREHARPDRVRHARLKLRRGPTWAVSTVELAEDAAWEEGAGRERPQAQVARERVGRRNVHGCGRRGCRYPDGCGQQCGPTAGCERSSVARGRCSIHHRERSEERERVHGEEQQTVPSIISAAHRI